MKVFSHCRFTILSFKLINKNYYSTVYQSRPFSYRSHLLSSVSSRCTYYTVTKYQPDSRNISFGCNLGTSAALTRMKTALVLVIDGTEEMEFTISADVLRRAGVLVTVAGVKGVDPVKCSRDVVIIPDASLADAVKKGPYDAVVLPGGPGYLKMIDSEAVGNVLKEQEKTGRIIAAICAAPAVLAAHGVATGKNVTSYPSVKDKMEGYKYKEDKVVVDGNLVTSRGPGTAFDFALAVAEKLTNPENVANVKNAMLL